MNWKVTVRPTYRIADKIPLTAEEKLHTSTVVRNGQRQWVHLVFQKLYIPVGRIVLDVCVYVLDVYSLYV